MATPPARTHTNAPRHWPQVTFEFPENTWMSTLQLVGALAGVLQPPKATLALMTSSIYEDGILKTPLVVTEDGRKICVFVYSTEDTEAAAHYSAVRSILRTRENATAVYYGPEALMPASSAKVLEPIDTPMFLKPEQPRDARYALWWATPEDPSFTHSADRALLDRWFEVLDGYGYLLFSAFVNDLELVEESDESEESQRLFSLPEQPFLEPLSGPGSTDVLLYASAPDGVFLGFDQERVTVKQRQLLLRLLVDFVAGYRSTIEGQKIARRPEERGLAAWRTMRDEAIAKEANGETGLSLHAVAYRAGQSMRSPGAHSAAERAAQPEVPDRELLDFGMDLVDRAAARLQSRPVAQSSQDQLGVPNVFPVIAARVAGRLWEREVAYEDAAQAQAASGRVLDEWPAADMAAFLTDAAIRENGQRVDILHATVQRISDGMTVSVFQRYKGSATGIELVGRPTAMPEKAFVQPPSPIVAPQSDPVDSVVHALALMVEAQKTIAQIMVPPESAEGLDQPVTMPTALVGKEGSGPTMIRFAMQGPISASQSCVASLAKHRDATSVVFFFDDLIRADGVPDRRFRFVVCRRGDGHSLIIDQPFETPAVGKPFAWKGAPEVKRFAVSLLP